MNVCICTTSSASSAYSPFYASSFHFMSSNLPPSFFFVFCVSLPDEWLNIEASYEQFSKLEYTEEPG